MDPLLADNLNFQCVMATVVKTFEFTAVGKGE